jgi:hypothetical protein
MIDIAHPAIATALLAARAALACDAEPELEERALRLIASASVPSTPASPAHRLLLSRATETITTWQAGREADRQVAPDIDRALTLLGFAAQFEDYERKTWLPSADNPLAGWLHANMAPDEAPGRRVQRFQTEKQAAAWLGRAKPTGDVTVVLAAKHVSVWIVYPARRHDASVAPGSPKRRPRSQGSIVSRRVSCSQGAEGATERGGKIRPDVG